MRSSALNAARRLGFAHGHAAHAPTFTPRSCTQTPLRRRYWTARDRAEAAGTILVWWDAQRVPAAVYAAAHMPGARVVVDRDPSIRSDPARRIVRYHFV